MKLLEDMITRYGKIGDGGVLKVDGFLNHQIDVGLVDRLGEEFYRIFGDCDITKILTVEASGIGIACLTARYFRVPVLFAKKSKTVNLSGDVYSAPVFSFTHKKNYEIVVSKEFLTAGDRVLIIDDFLAMGSSIEGLRSIIQSAGAALAGAGIVIEKAFQPGGAKLRSEGVRIESLARIAELNPKTGVVFAK